MSTSDTPADFRSLGLPESLLEAIARVGYETPSPIQAQSIPVLLDGRDLLGQAQTGTGKTAAFALPLLARIDVKRREPQLLVLAPTRELAIQVAEACQSYARGLPGFHVLPIYGGQDYTGQFKQLKHGAQVIVGTPGRVMDHIRKGTLKLEALQALVLDEADEMLRMGFIDDVEWILQHTPAQRQIALFSATMPKVIREVAERHLRKPEIIKIESKTSTATTVRQRYWPAAGLHKLDALTRILETEPFDAALIFVRTKVATEELAEKLSARGHACEALNGDIAQAQREKTVDKLRRGQIDILVATDVVARGLDVPRISHVINYDIPYDTESYVHRIGRTGRAGRSGEAILFVARREMRMLKSIERATRQPIEPMALPSVEDVNQHRLKRFKQRIADTVAGVGERGELGVFESVITEYLQETGAEPLQVAAALAHMAQGDAPLLMAERFRPERREKAGSEDGGKKPKAERGKARSELEGVKMEHFRLEVGYQHGVKPGNIVGAIANEADIEACFIGQIEIHDTFSTVDLPAGMPREVFSALANARVCQQRLAITRLDEKPAKAPRKPKAAHRGQGGDKFKGGGGFKGGDKKSADKPKDSAKSKPRKRPHTPQN